MTNVDNHICRACGFNNPDEFWEQSDPNYIICPCCGCESGNEDFTIESTLSYRENWIAQGMKWFSIKEKPENWNAEEQFSHIPQMYK